MIWLGLLCFLVFNILFDCGWAEIPDLMEKVLLVSLKLLLL